MEWVIKPNIFTTPVFIIWRTIHGERKGRVIINLQTINRVTILNNYPLPSQKKIINYLIGIKYITVLNINNYFYQYRIHPKDRHIFIITSYYGLEGPTVVIIGFRNNPAYV